jgi:ABC-type transport system involved in Fe-S cluster assembly fused permease/ATPase subunit
MKQMGKKIVRHVSIKGGQGYKSVSRYHRRKHMGTIRKTLKRGEIEMITLWIIQKYLKYRLGVEFLVHNFEFL